MYKQIWLVYILKLQYPLQSEDFMLFHTADNNMFYGIQVDDQFIFFCQSSIVIFKSSTHFCFFL